MGEASVTLLGREAPMAIIQRPFAGEPDLRAMAALASTFPDDHLHTVDLPYRFSSWALDDPANAVLWTGPDGTLLAWAVLQPPFWALDYALHPAAPGLHRRVLAWGDERARRLRGGPSGRPCWFAVAFADQAGRCRELEAAGYASQADAGEDAWSKVLLERRAADPLPAAELPPGYVLRPLAGEGEAAAYVNLHRAAFGSENMTLAWRRRTLVRPEHLPDLDLVVQAPGGGLAAFCIGWLDPVLGGRIEPLGVHPNYRGRGLGRAVLAEAVRRMHARGAAAVRVETDVQRVLALGLYTALGFRAGREALVYRKNVEEG